MLYATHQAAQRNAADPQQGKRAARLVRRRNERLKDAYRAVLETPQGRALLWAILATCGVYKSVWENSARIHYNAGRQDVGHELLADLHLVSTDLYLVMEREARETARREQAEIDGARTPPATEDEGEDGNG